MSDDGIAELRREFGGERGDLIPALQRVQARDGYLRPDVLREISRWLKISENEIFGVATFYAQFRFEPPGRHHLKVCLGTACHVKGGSDIIKVLEKELGVKVGGTTADRFYTLSTARCFGACGLAPVLMLDEEVHGRLNPQKAVQIVRDLRVQAAAAGEAKDKEEK